MPLPLDIGVFLIIASSQDLIVSQAGLLLLHEVLKSKPNPFITLQESDGALKSLYFTLQNQAVKVITQWGIFSWKRLICKLQCALNQRMFFFFDSVTRCTSNEEHHLVCIKRTPTQEANLVPSTLELHFAKVRS